MLLTVGFVVVASMLFAAFSSSPFDLFSFPVVLTVWVAYLWVLIGQSVRSVSKPPHSPRRITTIVIIGCLVAFAALVVSIAVGLFILRVLHPLATSIRTAS